MAENGNLGRLDVTLGANVTPLKEAMAEAKDVVSQTAREINAELESMGSAQAATGTRAGRGVRQIAEDMRFTQTESRKLLSEINNVAGAFGLIVGTATAVVAGIIKIIEKVTEWQYGLTAVEKKFQDIAQSVNETGRSLEQSAFDLLRTGPADELEKLRRFLIETENTIREQKRTVAESVGFDIQRDGPEIKRLEERRQTIRAEIEDRIRKLQSQKDDADNKARGAAYVKRAEERLHAETILQQQAADAQQKLDEDALKRRLDYERERLQLLQQQTAEIERQFQAFQQLQQQQIGGFGFGNLEASLKAIRGDLQGIRGVIR